MTAIDSSFSDSVEEAHVAPSFLRKYIFSQDHKIIGIQFMISSLLFMILGGLLAMLIRWQLAWPDAMAAMHPVPILGKWLGWPGGVMPSDFYIMIVSMHATIMIFFVVIPLLVGAFGNYLIPLAIGARDMAFPFLNGLAFWMGIPAGAIMLAAFFLPAGAAQTGWTSYPPLSAIHQSGAGGCLMWCRRVLRIEIAGFLRAARCGECEPVGDGSIADRVHRFLCAGRIYLREHVTERTGRGSGFDCDGFGAGIFP